MFALRPVRSCCAVLHRVSGLRGRQRAWLFRGSDLKKSPASGAFVCWRWRAGGGDNVAQLVAAGYPELGVGPVQVRADRAR